MKRILSIWSASLSLAIAPLFVEASEDRLHLHDRSDCCPDEVNRELRKLERQLDELENMLLRNAPRAEGRFQNGLISDLQKQTETLENLTFRGKRRPVTPPLTAKLNPGPLVVSPAKTAKPRLQRTELAPDGQPLARQESSPQILAEDSRTYRKVENPVSAAASSPLTKGGAICATLRLKSRPVPAEAFSSSGPNLFGIFVYEVMEVSSGILVSTGTIRVAQGIRWSGAKTGVMDRPNGTVITLDLVPLWWYPSLKNIGSIGGHEPEEDMIFTPRLHQL